MEDRFRIAPYLCLLRSFLCGEIGASEFEDLYLRTFKNDPASRPREVFLVLDRLFGDVDAFVADDDLRDEEDLDEAGLLAAAGRALSDLERFEGHSCR